MSETDVEAAILRLLRGSGPLGWYGMEIRLSVPRAEFKDGYTLVTYLEEMIAAGSVRRVVIDGVEHYSAASEG